MKVLQELKLTMKDFKNTAIKYLVEEIGRTSCAKVSGNSNKSIHVSSEHSEEASIISRFLTYLHPFSFFKNIVDLLKAILLPNGYPDSVCPEYVMFQLWDTLQEACGYFRGILASQAWLTTLGVGNSNITVVNAVVMTMILDYMGMVSGLMFGGSSKLVRTFAANQKFYTMLAEALGLVSTILTLSTVLYPYYMLFILLLGRIISSSCTVASGACHSTLVTHIARKNNFSDCNAKEGNQTRALKLVLIGIGYKFLIFVNEDATRVSLMFIVLSTGKLVFRYQSMNTLNLRTLSPQRVELILDAWKQDNRNIVTPYDVGRKESILYPKYGVNIQLGVSLNTLKCSEKFLAKSIELHSDFRHILVSNKNIKEIVILLKEGASDLDILFSYFHAIWCYNSSGGTEVTNDKQALGIITKSLKDITKVYSQLLVDLENVGWDVTNISLLPLSQYRLKVQTLEDQNGSTEESKKTL